MLFQKGLKNREWGSTEAMAAALLVAVATVSLGVVGFTVLASESPQKLPAFNAIISSTPEGEIVIYHDGGDMVEKKDMKFMVNNVQKEFSKILPNSQTVDDWDSFSMGETLVYNYMEDGIDEVTSVDMLYGSGAFSSAVASAQFAPDKEVATLPSPGVNFTATPTSGYAPLTVSFTDLSTNTPISWFWDFGDGTTSAVQSPTHIYSSAGSYTVSLTAGNTAGNATASRPGYITVTTPPLPDKPVANFTATPTSGISPLFVQFSDLSTNTPTSWFWDFGDGTTSTAQNPTHTYTNTGTYTVNLTATNAGGSDSLARADYIAVLQYMEGWRATYYDDEVWTTPVYTNYPSRLRFANVIAITNYSYLSSDVQDWPTPYLGRSEFFSAEFEGYLHITTPATYTFYLNSDDGSWLEINGNTVIDNGGLHPPEEESGSVYLGVGYHPINVRVFNHAEAAVLSLQYSRCGMGRHYVTDVWHTATIAPPVAAFSGTPTSGPAPLTVQFTDASTNSPTAWSWSFGEGSSSTEQNPSHSYTSAGTYTVTLTATNDGGSSSETKTGYITVTPASSQVPATTAYLVADNKCGYLGSGDYMQFTVTGYWSYITQDGHTYNLNPGDVVRLTLNGDERGEIYATSSYISTFNYEHVTLTINGVNKGTGRIHYIWINGYNSYSSTLTLNIPSKNKWTQFVADGSTIIYGKDNQEITLYNLYATTAQGMNLDNHDCSDIFYSGGITAYEVA